MNSKTVTALFAATLFHAGVFAQAPQSSAPVVTPSTPPPMVASTSSQAPTPAPNQLIYVPRLPTAQELTNAAAAQGRSIERIEQNNSQITLITRDASGQLNSVAYQLLPTAGNAPASAPPPANVTVVTSPPPTVVYTEPAPQVYYYEDYGPRYYAPWYPPVSLHLGFGYYRGFGGGYRGHFHHR